MSVSDNNDYNEDDELILTPEEIKLIKGRRQQIIDEQKNKEESFYTDVSSNSTQEPETNYRVNIPVKSIIDDYNENSYYSSNRTSHAADIPISKNYGRTQGNAERYDHNAYLAAQAKNHSEEICASDEKPHGKNNEEENSGCGCGTAFICILLAFAIAFVGCFGYIFMLSGKVQSAELNQNISADLAHSEDVKNILLIGLDKANGGVSRSDSMMLLSIDRKSRTLKLSSFLRDMWVSIPGYYNAKLNAAYAYGGPQLTVDTIESNFKVDIDHFVLVDFDMFEQIIDSLGGVTVDITEKEANFLRNNTRVKVPAGENTLSGEYALIYSRIRKLDSDFYRTQRQRKVMTAIINKAKKSSPTTLVKMLSDIMPLITTDIKPAELTKLAFSALRYIRYDIDQLQVPADNTYSSQMISGQAALVPDMERNIYNIYNFIYG